jgi:hypothetical protein
MIFPPLHRCCCCRRRRSCCLCFPLCRSFDPSTVMALSSHRMLNCSSLIDRKSVPDDAGGSCGCLSFHGPPSTPCCAPWGKNRVSFGALNRRPKSGTSAGDPPTNKTKTQTREEGGPRWEETAVIWCCRGTFEPCPLRQRGGRWTS